VLELKQDQKSTRDAIASKNKVDFQVFLERAMCFDFEQNACQRQNDRWVSI